MTAYYNEIDPYAAEWLRNLIAAGHIAPGVVDTRSIEDVRPDELAGYTQCHFFAGIGVWSRALRLAGWPDDRPVWTGSCPCQPFSAAGKGKGAADERHLWPAWQWLIAQCRPPVIFGEQVEAAIKHDWLDLVQADLEGLGYAVGAAGLPAAGVGAPHGRARLWFVAHDDSDGRGWLKTPRVHGRREGTGCGESEARDADRARRDDAVRRGADGELAHAGRAMHERICRPDEASGAQGSVEGEAQQWQRGGAASGAGSASGELADREREGLERHAGDVDDGNESGWLGTDTAGSVAESGRTGGMANPECRVGDGWADLAQRGSEGRDADWLAGETFWSDCDWLPCRDGKARPVEPGTFPLAHGVAARVGKLRAYGNAIVPQVAAEIIGAYLDTHPG